MGLRVRLKAGVNISGLSYQPASSRRRSSATDDPGRQRLAAVHFRRAHPRWNDAALHQLDQLTSRDFEVVDNSSLPHPGQ